MEVNKVVYNGKTLIDLTGDTVTPETLAVGVTAHNMAGEEITGTMKAGNDVTYDAAVTSGVQIGTLTIDGVPYALYAPSGSGGGQTINVVENSDNTVSLVIK